MTFERNRPNMHNVVSCSANTIFNSKSVASDLYRVVGVLTFKMLLVNYIAKLGVNFQLNTSADISIHP